MSESDEVRNYVVKGRVQGVGFRWFARRCARALSLAGWVRNLPNGGVEARASGSVSTLEKFEESLRRGPPSSQVDEVDCTSVSVEDAGDLPEEFAVTF